MIKIIKQYLIKRNIRQYNKYLNKHVKECFIKAINENKAFWISSEEDTEKLKEIIVKSDIILNQLISQYVKAKWYKEDATQRVQRGMPI